MCEICRYQLWIVPQIRRRTSPYLVDTSVEITLSAKMKIRSNRARSFTDLSRLFRRVTPGAAEKERRLRGGVRLADRRRI